MIDRKSYTYMTGSSGTGKSTRVQYLINILKDKYDSEFLQHEYTTQAGNTLNADTGIFFPEINTIIFSRPTIKQGTGIEGWNGMDTMKVGKPDSKQDFIDDLKRRHNDKNVLVEEYGGFAFRNRPNHVLRSDTYENSRSKYKFATGLGFERELIVIVSYNTFQEAKDRISGRGGKIITEDSRTWEMNSYFQNIRSNLEESLLDANGRATLIEKKFDEPVEQFSKDWLDWMQINL